MKTTLKRSTAHLFAVMLLFCFACSESDGVLDHLEKKGKVTFTAKEKERPVIRLNNARTQEVKDNHHNELEIKKGNEVVFFEEDRDQLEALELDAGQYTATIRFLDQSEKHKGRVYAEGSEDFTVTADNTTSVTIIMDSYTVYVEVSLVNLEGATVWIGEEGFTPTDDDLYPGFGTSYYIDGTIEIIVEHEGQQKSYTADAVMGADHMITITNNPDEVPQEETGSVGFYWEIPSRSPQIHNFTW